MAARAAALASGSACQTTHTVGMEWVYHVRGHLAIQISPSAVQPHIPPTWHTTDELPFTSMNSHSHR